MTKYYMGVSALHHDSAAVLIDEHGNIICASQEERRTQIKNDKQWPQSSIDWCMHYAKRNKLTIEGNLTMGYYEKPWLKFARRLYQNPKSYKKYFKEAASVSFFLARNAKTISHHKSHALSGCATAPFDDGVYLIVDAIGEWNTTTWGTFNHKTGIKQEGKINYPHSLGLLYSAFTRWLGLNPNKCQYIGMGDAAYGKTIYEERIFEELVERKKGVYKLKKQVHNGIEQYYGDEVPVNEWYDWCASIQYVCEEMMVDLVLMLQNTYGKGFNLVLGGGVALNCVANTKIMRHPDLDINDIWILPSPGDSGNALGAAAHAAGLTKLHWNGAFLGDDIDDGSNPTQALIRDIVGRLEKGQIVGWIQGQEEFGPRAICHR